MKGRARSRSAARQVELRVRDDLQRRRWLRWHAFLLGTTSLLVYWAIAAGLMHAGIDRLALRWPVAFGLAYAAFIGLLWLWCRWLLSRDEVDGDLPLDEFDLPSLRGSDGVPDAGPGGGSGGGFDAGDLVPDGLGEAAGHAMEVAVAAEEGAVVTVPLAIVVIVGMAIAFVLGGAVFALFGVEVMLGVAVEIAFASAGAAFAYKAGREGWFLHAIGRTAKPALGLVLSVAVAGAAVDHWLPQAHSLPQALPLLLGLRA